jgi:hypothetical protein
MEVQQGLKGEDFQPSWIQRPTCATKTTHAAIAPAAFASFLVLSTSTTMQLFHTHCQLCGTHALTQHEECDVSRIRSQWDGVIAPREEGGLRDAVNARGAGGRVDA